MPQFQRLDAAELAPHTPATSRRHARKPFLRCAECGMAFELLNAEMDAPGYALMALTKAVRFAEAHIVHGDVSVLPATFGKAPRVKEGA